MNNIGFRSSSEYGIGGKQVIVTAQSIATQHAFDLSIAMTDQQVLDRFNAAVADYNAIWASIPGDNTAQKDSNRTPAIEAARLAWTAWDKVCTSRDILTD